MKTHKCADGKSVNVCLRTYSTTCICRSGAAGTQLDFNMQVYLQYTLYIFKLTHL